MKTPPEFTLMLHRCIFCVNCSFAFIKNQVCLRVTPLFFLLNYRILNFAYGQLVSVITICVLLSYSVLYFESQCSSGKEYWSINPSIVKTLFFASGSKSTYWTTTGYILAGVRYKWTKFGQHFRDHLSEGLVILHKTQNIGCCWSLFPMDNSYSKRNCWGDVLSPPTAAHVTGQTKTV